MSRDYTLLTIECRRVPRASGDEPSMPGKIKDALGCSPRERG